MKQTFTLILACLWCWATLIPLRAVPLHFLIGGNTTSTPGAGTEIDEGFEGTGLPSGWTETGATWNYDLGGGSQLAGNESATNGATGNAFIYKTITYRSSYVVEIMFRMADATPASTWTAFGFRTAAAGAVCLARVTTAGKMGLYIDGADRLATTDGLSDNTTYYARMEFVDGGRCKLEFNTTNSFTGSGNKYTQYDKAAVTSDAVRFYVGGNGGTNNIFDRVLVTY